MTKHTRGLRFVAPACFGILAGSAGLAAQQAEPGRPAAVPAAVKSNPQADTAAAGPARAPGMERFPGVWVEGPGFEVTYGGAYEGCAQRCTANAKCVMIEYYRPEKKCNLYNTLRPRKNGGSSDVAIRR
jgi:PAN domain